MTKIAKAKKSTHSKGKGTKVLRAAGKQPPSIAKTVRENPHQQWEIDVSFFTFCNFDKSENFLGNWTHLFTMGQEEN